MSSHVHADKEPKADSSEPVSSEDESGVDLTLVRSFLKLTPTERLTALVNMGRLTLGVRRVGSR